MGAAIGQGSEAEDDDLGETSEINVTPFIDVILVLLIIFMVAAPLSTVDAPVELPVSTARPQPRPDKPVFLTLKADLSILVGEDVVPAAGLASAIDVRTRLDREQRLYIRADQSVAYGEVVRLMNALRAAGYLKIALVGLEGGAQGGTPPVAPPPGDPAATVPAP